MCRCDCADCMGEFTKLNGTDVGGCAAACARDARCWSWLHKEDVGW